MWAMILSFSQLWLRNWKELRHNSVKWKSQLKFLKLLSFYGTKWWVHIVGCLVHSSTDVSVRVLRSKHNMSNFLSLLVLAIIVGVISHPVQRRQTGDDRCTVITSVCTVLWHIQDTMEHCPAESACNSTAMGIIHSAIRTDFSAWVRRRIIIRTQCVH